MKNTFDVTLKMPSFKEAVALHRKMFVCLTYLAHEHMQQSLVCHARAIAASSIVGQLGTALATVTAEHPVATIGDEMVTQDDFVRALRVVDGHRQASIDATRLMCELLRAASTSTELGNMGEGELAKDRERADDEPEDYVPVEVFEVH